MGPGLASNASSYDSIQNIIQCTPKLEFTEDSPVCAEDRQDFRQQNHENGDKYVLLDQIPSLQMGIYFMYIISFCKKKLVSKFRCFLSRTEL